VDENFEDLNKLVDLTNEFIERFLDLLDPRKYCSDGKEFCGVCLTGPAIFAGTMIDKVSETFHMDKDYVLNEFNKRLSISLKCIVQKNENNENDLVQLNKEQLENILSHGFSYVEISPGHTVRVTKEDILFKREDIEKLIHEESKK
jgi:hypothetical protein